MAKKNFGSRITLAKNETCIYKFNNPHGIYVTCTVDNGAGTITLYENEEKVADYYLARKPGESYSVKLNTTRYNSEWRIEVKAEDEGTKVILELPGRTKIERRN